MNKTIQASTTQMAKSISKAGIRVISDVLRRRDSLVSTEVFNERTTVCKGCDSFRADQRCAECGCQMNLKAKFKFAECPLGKWNAQD